MTPSAANRQKEKNEQYFILFGNCIPVKGASRSVIVDLQRENMFFVSNDIYDLLSEMRKSSWGHITSSYNRSSTKQIGKVIDHLEANGLGFWTSTPDLFPQIDMTWDSPSVITNAIIDSGPGTRHNWKNIFKQLAELGCRDIQLRFFCRLPLSEMIAILNLLEGSFIKSVEIILQYSREYTKRALLKLVDEYIRIRTITLHGAPQDEIYLMNGGGRSRFMGNILFSSELVSDETHCGKISAAYFSISGVESFTESVNFNSCLNRKISVDKNGYIRNCPSLPGSYGHIGNTLLADAVTSEFSKVWGITKDHVSVCKDCEFRYVCTDCRAYTLSPQDHLGKPAKCRYNPYIAAWE
ncbi:MAG: grasp-with-spasm system SPASM domain peptide maturase [Dinghuibacter sp.]|nr:grasp-with-spasm system SPASM domain peptide maturase [Dinghuibacter sp.]